MTKTYALKRIQLECSTDHDSVSMLNEHQNADTSACQCNLRAKQKRGWYSQPTGACPLPRRHHSLSVCPPSCTCDFVHNAATNSRALEMGGGFCQRSTPGSNTIVPCCFALTYAYSGKDISKCTTSMTQHLHSTCT